MATGSLGTVKTAGSEDSQLIASDGCKQKPIQLKANVGALSRGTVMAMNTTTFLWEQHDQDGSTGVNVARAILAVDVEDDTAAQESIGFFIGKYRLDDLIFQTDITRIETAQAISELADVGIEIDESYIGTVTSTTTSTTTSSSTTSSTSSTTTTTTSGG